MIFSLTFLLASLSILVHAHKGPEKVANIRRSRVCPSSSSSSSWSSSSSSSVSCITEYQCEPCDAVQTVISRDNDLLALINRNSWSAANVLIQPCARFTVLDDHNGVCLKQGGPFKNAYGLFEGAQIFDIIQSVNYDEGSGNVIVRAVELVDFGCEGKLNVRDVTRVWSSTMGCDYKLDFWSGTSFLCRTSNC